MVVVSPNPFLNHHDEFCVVISDHIKQSLKNWQATRTHFLDHFSIFLHTHPQFVSMTGIKFPCVRVVIASECYNSTLWPNKSLKVMSTYMYFLLNSCVCYHFVLIFINIYQC